MTRCKLQLNTYVLKTWIKNTCLFSLLLLSLLACEKPPEFDRKPVIEFNKIFYQYAYLESTKNTIDTVNISLRFKDGDGDLGVEKSDIDNVKYRAYSDTIRDTLGNIKSYVFRNYYLKTYRKEAGKYVQLNSDFKLNGTFSELISYDEVGPIEGELNFGQIFTPSQIKNKDTLKFEVYIMDRALNKSNTILTDSIVINRK